LEVFLKATAETTVLVVDDEKLLCDAIAADFNRRGYKTICAYNGRFVKSQQIDLVVSDIRMPDGDGIELLKNIRSHNYEHPVVVFITGFADLSLEQAYDLGADAIFAKPFDRKIFMSAVQTALKPRTERWQHRPERFEIEAKVVLRFPNMPAAIEGRMMNIGRGGIFVALDNYLPQMGTNVLFQIEFENMQPKCLEGEAIVRWIRHKIEEGRPPGCGLEFMTLNDEGKAKVLELIARLKTKAFIPRF
jgi:CheY-like chemotaxis protein/Tfp pilus assembly protein PilZ